MEQFRTTLSLVFWTDTTGQALEQIKRVKDAVDPEDSANVLSTVEFVDGGKPTLEPPEPETVETIDMTNGNAS